jgi:DNA-binding MarR family transcriptional regulator
MASEQQGLLLMQHLGQTYRALQGAFSRQVGHALPRWRILFALYERGDTSQKDLAERCRLDPASLTRLLQAMQKLGWVDRQVDAHDNRLTIASLTATGRSVVDAALPQRAAFFRALLDGLSAAEVNAMNGALNRLEHNAALMSGHEASSGKA